MRFQIGDTVITNWDVVFTIARITPFTEKEIKQSGEKKFWYWDVKTGTAYQAEVLRKLTPLDKLL